MRSRPLAITLTILAGAFAWPAEPALSQRPYAPTAVDFEQELPHPQRVSAPAAGPAHGPDGRVHAHLGAWLLQDLSERWISPVIAAPDRFDLVGIARELRPVEFRAREIGEPWSDWIETSSGDPVYFGGADELQVRARFRPAGRLHYVNVSGSAGGLGERRLTEARRAISSAFVSLASNPATKAAPPKPRFISRELWGANAEEGGCPPRTTPAYGQVRAGVVHHTVTANDYTAEEAPGIVLGICRYHVYANGWNDIGYQALVDRFGRVYVGRAGGMNRAVVGAQAQGFNAQTTGVASIGTHTGEAIGRKGRSGIVRFLSWKLRLHRGLPVTGRTELISAGGELTPYPAGRVIRPYRVIGHRRLDVTACPGNALYAQVGPIRKQIQRRIKKFERRKRQRRG